MPRTPGPDQARRRRDGRLQAADGLSGLYASGDSMTEITQAISIRAPWWLFILHGGKDVENRDWPTRFRGTVYLHSSSWWRGSEIFEDVEFGAASLVAHGN
jgi:hypothetical protein